ncbi:MAG: DUF2333 family protein [Sphingomonadales bacterium]|nr:DUF2333 family protein [Sphingomonadales bacterium]
MWHRIWSTIKRWLGAAYDWLRDAIGRISPRNWGRIGLGFLAFLFLYYLLGMAIMHKIDDDPDFRPGVADTEVGGSVAVAAVAGLIDREVNGNGWTANDPFFKPSALLDNMPNYQQGMVSALASFSFELKDQIGRTRGSSASDADLEQAAGLLQYPGDIWVFNFSASLLPVASSERQYLAARKSLLSYNRRLAQGDAVFERRSDNLLATLDRIALDIGAASAALDTHVADHARDWFDFYADDLFYNVKGKAYAYLMILRALKQDYSSVIAGRELDAVYDQMLASFDSIVDLSPLVVINGDTDGQVMPNHLVAQGFFLLRARTQLREITNILLK